MSINVLIPTDYSKNAFNAISYAFDLYKDDECNFHIFHSYFLARSAKGNLLFPEPEPAEYEAVEQASEKKMVLLKNNVGLLGDNPKHIVSFDHKYGTLIELLNEKILKENIDILVMGTRGATEDAQLAYGRNSVNVMENVENCPVLAIPATISYKKVNEIVFPTNFKSHYKENEMHTFVKIAKQQNATIQVFHIGKETDLSEKQKSNRAELELYFKDVEYKYHWLENVGVKEGLLLFVEQRNSGMISFINKKHWFFGSIFSNPLVKKLGVHSTVPLLALHDARN